MVIAIPPVSFRMRSFRPVRGSHDMLSWPQSRSHQCAGKPTLPMLDSLKGPSFHCTASNVVKRKAGGMRRYMEGFIFGALGREPVSNTLRFERLL